MEKRLWKNKTETSLLGFGIMRVTMNDGKIDEDKAMKLIDYAYKHGVNYFDTAMPYSNGQNEELTGKALSRYDRSSYYLATKLSLWMFETKDEVLKVIDKQLSRLKTTYIDNYLLHSMNKEKLEKVKEWGLLDVLKEWKKEGKIRNIGFSFHDSYEVFKEMLELYDWDFCQIQLNYLDTDIQQGLKGYYDLKERGIDVVVMEPIKGGRLSSFNQNAAKYFEEYSSSSLSSWALRWVASLDGVKVVLSGMNEMEQVQDNIKTFENFKELSLEENNIVEKVKQELKKQIAVGCTNCKYCMPCPKGVDIPMSFYLYNDYSMYLKKDMWQYGNLVKKENDPSKCINCKACVKKCPQNIDIPTKLKEMLEIFSK